MRTIEGRYSTAIIYADTIDDTAVEQLKILCDQLFLKGCKIRIMPDVHAGTGCVIGFTADLGEMVIPSIVGVDIGCGMLTVKLGNNDIDFDRLDAVIREYVPSGMDVHEQVVADCPDLENLYCYNSIRKLSWVRRSLGTLGGGNHFIEIDADDNGEKYLVIHTGSRSLGVYVEGHYEQLAFDAVRGADDIAEKQLELIAQLKAEGRFSEIQSSILALKKEYEEKTSDVPRKLCYLTGKNREKYLHDMDICQRFAVMNRETIASTILSHLFGSDLTEYENFHTIHNYIDFSDNIVRKGSVSAREGELLLIPINMRDGALICRGKGNPDWNCSAPHGAGRLLSRSEAHNTLSMEEYRKQMKGIYSTSVCSATLDESPMAYKSINEIVRNITPTVDILKQVKPVYNYKASE